MDEQNYAQVVTNVLKETFEMVDKRIVSELTTISKDATGNTVGVIVIVEKTIFVANLGDTEAVLGKRSSNGKCVPQVLTSKHKPEDANEKRRIVQLGGKRVQGACVWLAGRLQGAGRWRLQATQGGGHVRLF